MKITNEQLKKIISEEIAALQQEQEEEQAPQVQQLGAREKKVDTATTSGAMMGAVKAQMLLQLTMFAGLYAMNKMGEGGSKLVKVFMALAAAAYAYKVALAIDPKMGYLGLGLAVTAGLGGGYMLADMFSSISKTPTYNFEPVTMDSGGMVMRAYDSGGRIGPRHFPVMVEPGETIVPKTQNMLGSGITLNIQGDIVTNDAEDFAERIAEVLPKALRNINDSGGF